MKVILIKPDIVKINNRRYNSSERIQPLAIANLSSLVSSDVEVKFYDDRLESIPYDEKADLVAMSVEAFTTKRAYQIAQRFCRRGVKVVMGGYHPTLIPEEAGDYADTVVVGEAEELWPKLISDFKKKKLKKFYKQDSVPSLKGIRPRRDIYRDKLKKYLPLSLVQFSRGCKYSCNFCATPTVFKQTHRCRDYQEVVEEIKELGRKYIFFVDDNITGDPEKAKQLFSALIPLKIRWISQASIEFAQDKELMESMVKSGCVGLVVGFESIKRSNLTMVDKECNLTFGSYEPLLLNIRKAGLMLWAAFLLGYDAESKDSFSEVVRFTMRHKFAFAAFNILMPYPNTSLYQRLKEERRLLCEKWWIDSQFRFSQAVFQPRLLSPLELTEGCWWARLKVNSFRSILKRSLDFKTNMRSLFNTVLFFHYNLVFRREMLGRRYIKLGTM